MPGDKLTMTKTFTLLERRECIHALREFTGRKIGVFGDLMLDSYFFGTRTRLSPEAPAPVVLVGKRMVFPGGAANVASNIASLGGRVILLGIMGKDEAGNLLQSALQKKSIDCSGIIVDTLRPTTQKTRIVLKKRQLVRIDSETDAHIDRTVENKLLSFLSHHMREWDAVVVSDYAKGLCTKRVAQHIVALAKKYKKPLIADVKPKNASLFKGVSIILPNHKEASAIAGTRNVSQAGRIIQKRLACSVLITQGARGMTLFHKEENAYFPARALKIFDVTGAGDTVTAVVALALALGLSFKEAAFLSNEAAGIVVKKQGTATVSAQELERKLRTYA